jgi:membrane-associated protease RseP (regulator of RpoE activity)
VGIAQATGEVYEEAGWVALIQLAALLSINLAVLNILPCRCWTVARSSLWW